MPSSQGQQAGAVAGRSLCPFQPQVFGAEGRGLAALEPTKTVERPLEDAAQPTRGRDSESLLEARSPYDSSETLLPRDLASVPQDLLCGDPLLRSLAAPLNFASAGVTSPGAVNTVNSVLQLDQIAIQLVRRLSVGSSGRQSSVRLELGEGRHAGLAVLVTSERGQLSVTIQGRDTDEAERIAVAIRERLQRRGFDAVEVCTD